MTFLTARGPHPARARSATSRLARAAGACHDFVAHATLCRHRRVVVLGTMKRGTLVLVIVMLLGTIMPAAPLQFTPSADVLSRFGGKGAAAASGGRTRYGPSAVTRSHQPPSPLASPIRSTPRLSPHLSEQERRWSPGWVQAHGRRAMANERASEPTRAERGSRGPRARACRGVRGTKPLGVSKDHRDSDARAGVLFVTRRGCE
jgi:hypothetical protein